MNVLETYLSGNVLLGLLCFVLVLWISRTDPESTYAQKLTQAGKIFLLGILTVNIPVNIAIMTHNIPPRANGYIIGDGLCDYTGATASIGLFETVMAKYNDENGDKLLLIGYEVRALNDLRNDRLVGEYSSRLEWLAYLDKERMSNGWLMKTIILVVSVVFLILAGYWSGVGSAFVRRSLRKGPPRLVPSIRVPVPAR